MEGTNQPGGTRRRWGRSAAVLAAGLLVGGVLVGSLSASAASSSSSKSSGSSSASSSSSDTRSPSAPMVKHGPGETLLTGTTAQKVRAAALDAVPGGTIIRVETDSNGSPYEAHVRKSDGSEVTVKVNESFKVTDIEAHDAPSAPSA